MGVSSTPAAAGAGAAGSYSYKTGKKNQLTGQSNRRGTHSRLWGFLIAQRLESGDGKTMGV